MSTFSPVGSDILERYENIVRTIWKQYTVLGNRRISPNLDSKISKLH